MRPILSAVLLLALVAAATVHAYGQELTSPIDTQLPAGPPSWPTDPALEGFPTGLTYCTARAEPLLNSEMTLWLALKELMPEARASGPVWSFLQKRTSQFAAEALMQAAGMYGDPPSDLYQSTLDQARNYVRRHFGHGATAHGMEATVGAVRNLSAALDAARGQPDESLSNCGLVLLRATLRENPQAAPLLWHDLMVPYLGEMFVNASVSLFTDAAFDYPLTDEGRVFPEGVLKAGLERRIQSTTPEGGWGRR